MALSGTLIADFTSFTAACAGAEAQLKAMELGAGKSGQALNDMVIKFSGTTIVTEAMEVAEAVDRIGGVSKLTASELRQVGAVATEATAKMRALGVDIPPRIQHLADVTKGAARESTGLLTSLQPLAAAFGVAFTVGAVISFGKELLADADAMVKLSDKTGIAIEPMQRLKFIAEQSGNTFAQVAGAVTSMQQRIAGGNNDAVSAVRELGIELSVFKTLSPDQQFIAIATEVAKIQDPMERAKVATELFGRAGAEVLPTLIANVKELGDQAPVMSVKAVQAFDAVGDAASHSWTRIKNAAGEGLGAAIDGYGRLLDVATALATGDLVEAAAVLGDLKSAIIEVGPPTDAFSTATEKLGLSWEEAEAEGRRLTREVQVQIGNAKHMADLEGDLKKAVEARTTANDKAAKAAVAAAEPVRVEVEKQIVKVKELDVVARDMGKSYVDAFEAATRAAATLLEEQKKLNEEARKAQLASRSMGGSFEVNRENFAATARGLGKDAGQIEELLRRGYSFQQAMLWAGHPEWAPPEHPGPRVPGFARGVTNFGGGLAMVGERGPELVQLPSGSSVFPSGRGGGGTTINNVTIHAGAVGSEQELARIIQRMMVDLARANGQRLGVPH